MAMQTAEAGSLYQGPPVLVRNTFLDFEEPVPELRRVRTAPAQSARPDADDADETQEEEEEETEEEAEEFDHSEQPPLSMGRTEDFQQERGDLWEWAGGATGQAFSATSGTLYLGDDYAPSNRTTVSLEAMTAPPSGPPMGAVTQMAPMGQFQQQFMMVQVPVVHLPMAGTAPVMSPQDVGLARPPPPWNRPVLIDTDEDAPPPPTYTPAAGKDPGPPLERIAATLATADVPTPSRQAAAAMPPLWREPSARSGYYRINWSVDARKLKSKDTQAVSPPFELSLGSRKQQCVAFKLMIRPELTAEGRGGSSFKKAKGRGRVILKCESETELDLEDSLVCFRIAVSAGSKQLAFRGPVHHNFSTHASCGLREAEEIWDFSEVVAEENVSTFVVCLQIVPCKEEPV